MCLSDASYELVMWDFDGTVASTSEDVWKSLNYAASFMDAHFSDAFIHDDENLSLPLRVIYEHLVPFPGIDRYDVYEELVNLHYQRVNDLDRTELYSGIDDLIRALRTRRIHNVLVTNKHEGDLNIILEKKRWKGLFEDYFTPDKDYGTEKGYYGKEQTIAVALRQYGIPPNRCVYVGDMWSDVVAAHGNGMPAIAVTYGYGDAYLLADHNPEHIVSNVSTLKAVLLGPCVQRRRNTEFT